VGSKNNDLAVRVMYASASPDHSHGPMYIIYICGVQAFQPVSVPQPPAKKKLADISKVFTRDSKRPEHSRHQNRLAPLETFGLVPNTICN
jgi:hypothetical protein